MLRLNGDVFTVITPHKYSNTTNVKVKQSAIPRLYWVHAYYSNTTNVKVKHCGTIKKVNRWHHSNTTNVKVKLLSVCSWQPRAFDSNTTNVKVKLPS